MRKEDLPSKEFIIRGGIATAIILIILIVQTAWFKNLFHTQNTSPTKALEDEKVGDVITKDSNGNGIADWEERLWGLDPSVLYTNGRPNKDIIAEKKLALGVKDTPADGSNNQSTTIAQKLFILSASLGQTEGADAQVAQGVAKSLGESVQVSTVSNHYSAKSIRQVQTTPASLKTYYTSMVTVADTLDTSSGEIDIVIGGLETGDFSRLSELTATGTAYRSLADTISKIPVPIGLAGEHLGIINGLYGVADSFDLIIKIQEDSFQGLAGIAAYKKYTQLLQDSLFKEHQYFIEYGIL